MKNSTKCYALNCVPANSDVAALNPNVIAFGDRPFKEVINVNDVIGLGPKTIGMVSL